MTKAPIHPHMQRIIDATSAEPTGDKYWIGRCPAHDDRSPSFSIWDDGKRLRFKCFAGDSEAKIIEKLLENGIIANEGELLTGSSSSVVPAQQEEAEEWQAIPIPDTQARELKPRETPTNKYLYRDYNGKIQQIICRYDLADGKKRFTPYTLRENKKTGETKWLAKGIKRPLPYNADRLYSQRDRRVIFCEGEKAAGILQTVLRPVDYITTTTVGGANRASQTDFTVFRNLECVIWPDADLAGKKYAEDVAVLLKEHGAASVKIIIPPADVPQGWDAADAIAGGYDEAALLSLINNALPAEEVALLPDPIIDEINAEYAVLKTGGSRQIMRIYSYNGQRQIDYISLQNMRVNLAAESAIDGYGERVKYWIHHPKRREYDRVVFEPGIVVEQCYNLWQGMAVAPKQGDCGKFLNLLRDIIANGNDEFAEYLLNWMANIVQNPRNRPGVAIVLHGDEGIGKGVFADYFGSLFGEHFLQVTNDKHMLHHFNSHLQSCLVLYADEAVWAGDKKAEGILKGFITEKRIMIEGKGRDAFQSSNYIHLIMSSNNQWIVPAGHGARRFAVSEVSNKEKDNTDYFKALIAERDNGGREALLHFLLQRDISAVNLRKIPKTTALREQKIHSMHPVQEFWYGRLLAGAQTPAADAWLPTVIFDEMYEAYVDETKKAGKNRHGGKTSFAMQFKKICQHYTPKREFVQVNDKDGKVVSKYMNCYSFGSLADCRKDFDTFFGMAFEWPEGESVADELWRKSPSKDYSSDDSF